MISYVTHSIHLLEYQILECYAGVSKLVQQVRGLLASKYAWVAYGRGIQGAQRTSGPPPGESSCLTPPREPEPPSVHGQMGMLLLIHLL
jgi:hypothetical protein